MKTVLLAFSGGLDTTFCIPFLQEKDYQVITATVNTGGFSSEELKTIESKSQQLGALEHFQIDATDELYDHYVVKIIQANYLRGGTYPSCVWTRKNRGCQSHCQAGSGKEHYSHCSRFYWCW